MAVDIVVVMVRASIAGVLVFHALVRGAERLADHLFAAVGAVGEALGAGALVVLDHLGLGALEAAAALALGIALIALVFFGVDVVAGGVALVASADEARQPEVLDLDSRVGDVFAKGALELLQFFLGRHSCCGCSYTFKTCHKRNFNFF